MITIDTSTWLKNGEWSIAPRGLDWIGEGAYAQIGAGARIGADAQIGADALFIFDLGFCDGYRKCLGERNGVSYVFAGCRDFTVKEAITHWSNHPRDRKMTMILIESAVKIAELHNLKLG